MFEILASISGVIAAAAYIPEIIKILRLKEAHDLSMVTFGIWLTHSLIWFGYGLSLGQLPVILYYSLGTIGAATVVGLSIYYNWQERKAAANV